MKASYAASVFINCPFDDQYRPMLFAAVFAILDCGYQPRCAQEVEDGGDVRIEKIRRIIEACKFGIHDISRTELSEGNALPRFNMPFELGIFLGARYFGQGDQAKKFSLIVDRERFRYQQFLSDIAGQDSVHRSTVTPVDLHRSRTLLTISASVVGSSAEVASSRISSLGLCTSARASAMR